MKPINAMKMEFLSKSANEGFARSVVAAFAASLDPTIDELADIKTAVSEAVTNCIVHAYRECIGKIYITAAIYEGGRLSIKIKDNGCGIDDVQKAMEPMYTTSPETERAGLGFSVMESFMDKLKVRSKPQKGTTVVMEKRINQRGLHNDARND